MELNQETVRASRRKRSVVDMRMVARSAGVSVSTVSRTINHCPTVNAKMAKRVWKAVCNLNYSPNTQARALVSGRSGLLGLVVSQMTDPFLPELIQAFEEMAVEQGYEILVSSSRSDAKRMELCVRRITEREAEGLVVMIFDMDAALELQLARCAIPHVVIDSETRNPGASVLTIDYQDGVRQGVQHLAALGHRSIAYISGPNHLRSVQSCLAAFEKSLAECGIPVEKSWVVEGDNTFQGGISSMEQLFSQGSLPTAVMCSNDITAVGVVQACSASGLRVPENISVMGFGDSQSAGVLAPSLTSVQISITEIARAAMYSIRARVSGKPTPQSSRIPTRLIVRKSTGFRPGSMQNLKQLENSDRRLANEGDAPKRPAPSLLC